MPAPAQRRQGTVPHLGHQPASRVYISVPEDYEQAANNGSPATLTLNEFPGRSFQGTIVRNANSIDLASRTLLVEVDVDNPTGELLPGAYVSRSSEVHGNVGECADDPGRRP